MSTVREVESAVIAGACDADLRHLDPQVHTDAAFISVHVAREAVTP